LPDGKDIIVLNDNGGKNKGKAEEYLASLYITQYWTHPYAPKEKPFVERSVYFKDNDSSLWRTAQRYALSLGV
jgi:hypothetical protein